MKSALGIILRAARLQCAAQALFCIPFLAFPAFADCVPEHLHLKWDGGQAQFHVEIADTFDERSEGLMFREKMGRFEGMLFVYDAPQPVSFWMRNTLIPLDMLFMDATGTVRKIHRNAIPGDLTQIPGGESIQFVLEVNGGMADRLGVKSGAVMTHPAIDQAIAAQPCQESN